MAKKALATKPVTPSVPAPLPPWPWAERLGLLLVFCLLLAKTLCPIYDQDLWFHMKGAQYMLRYWQEHRSIPVTDPFSYTATGHPWISSGWLSSLLLYILYSAFGPNGVILAVTGLVGVILVLLLGIWRREGAPIYPALIACALLLVGGAGRFRPRGDLFSLLLMAAFLAILLEYRRNRARKWLLILPLLSLLWANLHTGFTAGLLLFGLFLLGELPSALREGPESKREWVLVLGSLAASALATLVNPYGAKVWSFGLAIGRSSLITRSVVEWLSPFAYPMLNFPTLIATVALLLLAGVLLARARRFQLSVLLWLAVFLVMALKWRRQVVPLELVTIAVAALGARGLRSSMAARILSLVALTLMLIWALLVGSIPGGSEGNRIGLGVDRAQIPLAAASFIERHHLPGPLFNTYSIGGALIWGCYPRLKVYVDGRADVYGDRLLGDYFALLDHPDRLMSILEQRKIRLVVIGPPDPIDGIAAVLAKQKNWHLVYFDDSALVYAKEMPQSRSQLEKLCYHGLQPTGAASLDSPSPDQIPELRAEMERALREGADSVRVRVALGVASLRLGENKRAIEHLRRAVALNPTWPEAHTMLGIALWEEGQRKEGLSHLQWAVRLRPDGGSEELNLAMALADMGQTEESRIHYAQGYYLLAIQAAKRQDLAQAAAMLQALAKADPGRLQKAIEEPAFSEVLKVPGLKSSLGLP